MLISDTWGWSENIIWALHATVGITVVLPFILESVLYFRRTGLSMQVRKTHALVIISQIFPLKLSLLFSIVFSVCLARTLTQTGAHYRVSSPAGATDTSECLRGNRTSRHLEKYPWLTVYFAEQQEQCGLIPPPCTARRFTKRF